MVTRRAVLCLVCVLLSTAAYAQDVVTQELPADVVCGEDLDLPLRQEVDSPPWRFVFLSRYTKASVPGTKLAGYCYIYQVTSRQTDNLPVEWPDGYIIRERIAPGTSATVTRTSNSPREKVIHTSPFRWSNVDSPKYVLESEVYRPEKSQSKAAMKFDGVLVPEKGRAFRVRLTWNLLGQREGSGSVFGYTVTNRSDSRLLIGWYPTSDPGFVTSWNDIYPAMKFGELYRLNANDKTTFNYFSTKRNVTFVERPAVVVHPTTGPLLEILVPAPVPGD